MNLAEAVRTTTFRWSLAISAALLLQSATLAGLFYLMTARHAIAEVDKALVADCRSIQGLSREAIADEVRRRVAGDVHRVNLTGLFDPRGQAVAGEHRGAAALPGRSRTARRWSASSAPNRPTLFRTPADRSPARRRMAVA